MFIRNSCLRFTVKAIDGDRGVNNRITYSLLTDHQDYFDIDADDGTVRVKSALDRENPQVSNGAYILTILVSPAPSESPFSLVFV